MYIVSVPVPGPRTGPPPPPPARPEKGPAAPPPDCGYYIHVYMYVHRHIYYYDTYVYMLYRLYNVGCIPYITYIIRIPAEYLHLLLIILTHLRRCRGLWSETRLLYTCIHAQYNIICTISKRMSVYTTHVKQLSLLLTIMTLCSSIVKSFLSSSALPLYTPCS